MGLEKSVDVLSALRFEQVGSIEGGLPVEGYSIAVREISALIGGGHFANQQKIGGAVSFHWIPPGSSKLYFLGFYEFFWYHIVLIRKKKIIIKQSGTMWKILDDLEMLPAAIRSHIRKNVDMQ